MLTPTQKRSAQAIVNIFETSAVLGEYGNVTVINGDTGHLTFGRSETTLGAFVARRRIDGGSRWQPGVRRSHRARFAAPPRS